MGQSAMNQLDEITLNEVTEFRLVWVGRTEDICEKKFKGTATTSLRAGETHSDEITERDQKKNLCAPKLKETEDI